MFYCISIVTDCSLEDYLKRQYLVPMISINKESYLYAGTDLFATDDMVDKEVLTMWNNLSEELKADYGQDFCRKVKGFMKNFRRKGVRYNSSLS